jgi:YD repeat-containing protein
MNLRYAKLLFLTAVAAACNDEPGPTAPPTPVPPPPPAVRLRDIVIPNLPSPYYHFEYDTSGRVGVASFASGLLIYDVVYDGGRISELRTNILVNRDVLKYTYDAAGRVSEIRYIDSSGLTYTTLSLAYDAQKLTRIERARRLDSGFTIDKTMSFSYHADGNLAELTTHRPRIDGRQDETTTVDRFEEYHDDINVDGFGLIHDEFFDHLVLLPGVQLQKANPARQIRTGDGINFRVDYRYTYDAQNRPLTKTGEGTLLNGADAGRRFQASSVFSYY